jgi:hypothetical protein
MHFLTSMIILFGFVLVICLGLAEVICDLSDMSVHASPPVLGTQRFRTPETEDERARANAPSSAADLRDTS